MTTFHTAPVTNEELWVISMRLTKSDHFQIFCYSHENSHPWKIEQPTLRENWILSGNTGEVPFPNKESDPGDSGKHKESNGPSCLPCKCQVCLVQDGDN